MHPLLRRCAKNLLALLERDVVSVPRRAVRHIQIIASRVQSALHRFWSGVWWLALRKWWQERKLTEALESTGDQSMTTRWATERYRVFERSMKFWRASPPLVLDVLEEGSRAKVPLSDLQLLALNRDLKVVGGSVQVRQFRWRSVFAFLSAALVLTQWALLSALIVLSPAPWLVKLLGVVLLTLLYWVLWSGFALYSTRANAAFRRWGGYVQVLAVLTRRDPAVLHTADFKKK